MAKYVQGPHHSQFRPVVKRLGATKNPSPKPSRKGAIAGQAISRANEHASQEILAFFREKGKTALAEIPVPPKQKALTLTTVSRWLRRTNKVTSLKSDQNIVRLLLELRKTHPGIIPELPKPSKSGGPRNVKGAKRKP